MKFAYKSKGAPQSASTLLNSKSFLEALDPEERWKLLNETSTGLKGALVPASWLGSARQTTAPGTLQAPRAVRDMQLRIQAAAAVADNAHLVQENRCLAEDNVLLQHQAGQLQVHLNELAERLRLGTNDRIETLELTVSSLRAAVADVAGLAHRVTRDNHHLVAQAQALSADRDLKAKEVAQLKLRVHELEQHYLAGLAAASTEAAAVATLAGNPLSALLTGEPLCPPAAAALLAAGDAAVAGSLLRAPTAGPLMAENGALRRGKEQLQKQVSDLQTRAAKSEAACRAAEASAATERAAASRALAAAQQKLTAAGKRVTGMGGLLKQAQQELTEKQAYIRKLEARLLHQHQRLTQAAAGNSSGSPARSRGKGILHSSSCGTLEAGAAGTAAEAAAAASMGLHPGGAAAAELEEVMQQQVMQRQRSASAQPTRCRSPLAYPLVDEIAAELAAAEEYQAWRMVHLLGTPLLSSITPASAAAAGGGGVVPTLRRSVAAAPGGSTVLPHQEVAATLQQRAVRQAGRASSAAPGRGTAAAAGDKIRLRSSTSAASGTGRMQTRNHHYQQQPAFEEPTCSLGAGPRGKWPGQDRATASRQPRVGWGAPTAAAAGGSAGGAADEEFMCEEEWQQQLERDAEMAEYAEAAAAAAAAEALPDTAGSEAVEFVQQVADMQDQLLDFEGQLRGLGAGLDAGEVQACVAAAAAAAAVGQQHGFHEALVATPGAAAAAAGAVHGGSSSSGSKPKNVKSTSFSSKAAGGCSQAGKKQHALSQLRARQQQHLQHKAAMAAAAAVHKRGVPAVKAAGKGKAAPASPVPVPHATAQPEASWVVESQVVAAPVPAQAAVAAYGAADAPGGAGLGACPSSSRVAGRLATVQDKLAAKLQEQRDALHAQRQQLQREREQYQANAAAGSSGADISGTCGQVLGGSSSSSSSSRVLQQLPEQDPVLVENDRVEVMFLNDLEQSAAFAALESSPPAAHSPLPQRGRHSHVLQAHSSASSSMGTRSPVGWQEAAPVCSSPVPRSTLATPVPAAVALRHSGAKAAGAAAAWGWHPRGLGPQSDTWQDVAEGVGDHQEEGYGDSHDGGMPATPPAPQQQEGGRAGSSTSNSRAGLGPSSWRAYMQEQQEWVPLLDSSS